jgi:hypothetical protein
MHSKLFLSVALAACTALPATAQTFLAENGVKVNPVNGGSFEVKPADRFGVPGQWCAAADYSRDVLGTPWGSRLYVQGAGSTRRSVVFGTDPAGAEPSTITIVSNSAKTPGANFSVQRAYAFCYDQRLQLNDFP